MSSGSEFTAALKKQTVYKFHVNSGYFTALVLTQAVAFLMLLSGSENWGTGIGNITINFHVYNAAIPAVFTGIWVIVTAILLTTRTEKDVVLSLPGNRETDFLSDLIFAVSGCLIGGAASVLIPVALRTPVYFMNMGLVSANGFYPSPAVLSVAAGEIILYLLMVSAAGYFAGTLFRLNGVFYVIVPVVAFLLFCRSLRLPYKIQYILRAALDGVFQESSFGMFTVKAVLIAALLYAASLWISNRMEVRK